MTISTFIRQGYGVLPAALTEAELSMLRTTCDTLLDEPPEDGGGETHNIGKGEARRFLRHRHRDFQELAAFLTSPTMARIVENHLGTPGYLFNEQFVVKGAGKGASFAWHQDGAYVGFDHEPYLSVWIALDDATEENGCVYLLPRDLQAQPGLDPHVKIDGTDELNGYFGEDPGLPMTASAGSVVTFSSLTLHRSGENRTTKPRRAYLAQYSPEPIIDPATGQPKRFALPL
jgi:ectoine hydroxylase-related dioxygenase (phytanoyl-CoA dioxygenase family)